MADHIKTKFDKFTWHNIIRGGEKEIRYLRENMGFANSHIADCASPPLRPKIEFTEEYIFILLTFPIFKEKKSSIAITEIDIFIGKDFLVTFHQGEINTVKDYLQKIQNVSAIRKHYNAKDSFSFALDMIESVYASLYPMLNHLSWDIDRLDSQLFTGRERELIQEILGIKKNIVDFRKSMQTHELVISELKHNYQNYFPAKHYTEKIHIILNHLRDVWAQLENHKDTINAVQETNESLITYRLDNIMKTLTIFSVVILPLSFIAGLFGMNTTHGMPFMGDYGFWKIAVIMAVGVVLMFIWFKKHRWL